MDIYVRIRLKDNSFEDFPVFARIWCFRNPPFFKGSKIEMVRADEIYPRMYTWFHSEFPQEIHMVTWYERWQCEVK